MTEALDRVVKYFDEFREAVNRCRVERSPLNLKSAYGALGRLRDRFKRETKQQTLTSEEQTALEKVFKHDKFIQGMMDLRTISEHVVKDSGGKPQIMTTSNEPLPIVVEVSAMPVFAGVVVRLPDTQGNLHTLDHLKNLGEAERRIGAALNKAGENRRKG